MKEKERQFSNINTNPCAVNYAVQIEHVPGTQSRRLGSGEAVWDCVNENYDPNSFLISRSNLVSSDQDVCEISKTPANSDNYSSVTSVTPEAKLEIGDKFKPEDNPTPKFDSLNSQSTKDLQISKNVLECSSPLNSSTELKVLPPVVSSHSTSNTMGITNTGINRRYFVNPMPLANKEEETNKPVTSDFKYSKELGCKNVNRSVYTSPNSSKHSPDIMLHNDKINILRQMSQVFNGEKKYDELYNIQSSAIRDLNDTIGQKIPESDKSCNQYFPKPSVQDKENHSVTLTNEKISQPPSPVKENISSLDKSLENLSQNVESLQENHVHHVPSDIYAETEPITVESFIGNDGVHVDIIEGFTFSSFETEEEMNRHIPTKVVKKRKKTKYGKLKVKRQKLSPSICDDGPITNAEDKGKFNVGNSKIRKTGAKINEINDLVTGSSGNSIAKEKLIHATYDHSNTLNSLNLDSRKIKPRCKNLKSNEKKLENIRFIKAGSSLPALHSKDNATDNKSSAILDSSPLSSCVNNPSISPSEFRKPFPLPPIKKAENTEQDGKEMIYIYHHGRLLTLGGSLNRISSSSSSKIKAKLALPRAHEKLARHSRRVSKAVVTSVEINKDLAEFALTALKPVNKIEPKSKPAEVEKEEKKKVKPSKENIIDILTAKLVPKEKESGSMRYNDVLTSKLAPKETESGLIKYNDVISTKLVPKEKESCLNNPIQCSKLASPTNSENSHDWNSSSPPTPKSTDSIVSPSKVKWNQDAILKKDVSPPSKAARIFSKNMHRFPSLSREMKRLNMNFVSCEKVSDETSADVQEKSVCTNTFCTLGCVCDSLKCKKRDNSHCRKVECMLNCTCSMEGLNLVDNSDLTCNFSILAADKENEQRLAEKEKDFKKTIVQSGSELYLLGQKRKRQIKLPSRFRDTGTFMRVPNSDAMTPTQESDSQMSDRKVSNSPKKMTRKFSLDVPWYDIKGASVWCMWHSCYDCYCLNDCTSVEDCTPVKSEPNPLLPMFQLEKTTDSKVIQINIPAKEKTEGGSTNLKKYLKCWVHNGEISCSRTCGYDRNRCVKEICQEKWTEDDLFAKIPFSSPPFIIGITAGQEIPHTTPIKCQDLYGKRATFVDGLNIDTKSRTKPIEKVVSEDKEQESNPPDGSDSEPSQISSNSHTEAESKKEDQQSILHGGIKPLGNEFSLSEMIAAEEKRGELELDLASRGPGKTLLVLESRFRKLINMSIIGIVDFNDRGKCIISSTESAEQLMTMQRIQRLISNNLIDVGPNMREIFNPSQADSRPRYVMITCNKSNAWEISGIVQKKSKNSESPLNNIKSFKPNIFNRLKVNSSSVIDVKANNLESAIKTAKTSDMKTCKVGNGSTDHVYIFNKFQNTSIKTGDQTALASSSDSQNNLESSDKLANTSDAKADGDGLNEQGPACKNFQKPENTLIEMGDQILTYSNDSQDKFESTEKTINTPDMLCKDGNELNKQVPATKNNKLFEKTVSKINDQQLTSVTSNESQNNLEPTVKMANTSDMVCKDGNKSNEQNPACKNEQLRKKATTEMHDQPISVNSNESQTKSVSTENNKSDMKACTDGKEINTKAGPASKKKLFAKKAVTKKNEQPTLSIPNDSLNTNKPETTSSRPLLRYVVNEEQGKIWSDGNVQIIPQSALPSPNVISSSQSSNPTPLLVNSSKAIPLLNNPTTKFTIISANMLKSPHIQTKLQNFETVIVPVVIESKTNKAVQFKVRDSNPILNVKNSKINVSNVNQGNNVQQSTLVSSESMSSPLVNRSFRSVLPKGPTNRIITVGSNPTTNFKANIVGFNQMRPNPHINVPHSTFRLTKPGNKYVQYFDGNLQSFPRMKFPSFNFQDKSSSAAKMTCTVSQPLLDVNRQDTAGTAFRIPLNLQSSSAKTQSSPPCQETTKCPPKPSAEDDIVSILPTTRDKSCCVVDLSLIFKSVKLHWITGTISRTALMTIFVRSYRKKVPLALTSQSRVKPCKFFGVGKCYEDESKQFCPLLIVGSKLESVTAALNLSVRELFRSNMVKYIVEESTSKQVFTYSYDVKGENLIKHVPGSITLEQKSRSLRFKIPVDSLRMKTLATEFDVTNITNPSNENQGEVITLSSDESENEAGGNNKDPLGPDDVSLEQVQPSISNSSTDLNIPTTQESESASINELSESNSITQPSSLTSEDTDSATEDEDLNISSEECSIDDIPGCSSDNTFEISPVNDQHSAEDGGQDKYKGDSDVQDSYNVDQDCSSNTGDKSSPASPPQTDCPSEESMRSDHSYKSLLNLSFENCIDSSPGTSKGQSSFLDSYKEISLDEANTSKASFTEVLGSTGCSMKPYTSSSSSTKSEDPNIESQPENSDIQANSVGGRLFPYSFGTQQNNDAVIPEIQSHSTLPGNKYSRRRNMKTDTIMEFRKVFGGASGFWSMDNNEKHNALEKIRRKGLSRMIENLFMRVTESSQIGRLPAKHVVLKEAEKTIRELRAQEVQLVKSEIGLRSSRSQLLHTLSGLVKDLDVDEQQKLELWISTHITNPTSKTKLEEKWKPDKIIFQDERIFTSSNGYVTISGSEITDYFASHTSGILSPKAKTPKPPLSRWKHPFGSSRSRPPVRPQAPKGKISALIKSRCKTKKLMGKAKYMAGLHPSPSKTPSDVLKCMRDRLESTALDTKESHGSSKVEIDSSTAPNTSL